MLKILFTSSISKMQQCFVLFISLLISCVTVTSESSQVVNTHSSLGPIAPPLPPLHPQIVTLRCPDGVIPYSKSTVAKIDARCLTDCSLMMGRSFRARWGKDYTLLSLSTKQVAAETTLSAPLQDVGVKLEGRVISDMSPCIVQRIRILGGQMEDSILDFQVCYFFMYNKCEYISFVL